MKILRNLVYVFSAIALIFTISCSDEYTTIIQAPDSNGDGGGSSSGSSNSPTVELDGSVGTRTLSSDTIYILDRFVYVDDGHVLTIPAGTIIKAKTGDGNDASALIVARGGRLVAEGTATRPIIFTSVDDTIQVGQTASSLDPVNDKGKWGGLIMLGDAPISAGSSSRLNTEGTEASIEGVPSEFTFSRYGGTNPSHNGGSLNYVSIRFTGTALATNDEIQGLTLGGVGSGTSIQNIEVFSSDDDGIECFGGSVNVTNLLVAYQSDDGIDLDQSYSGTIDNALVLLYNPSAGNDGFEIDGPEATANNTGMFTILNTTVLNRGSATDSRAVRLKSGAQGTIRHSRFEDFADTNGKYFYVDGGSATTNYVNGNLKVDSSEFDLTTIANGIDASASASEIDALFTASTANNTATTTFTKGANTSVFSWTEANRRNLVP